MGFQARVLVFDCFQLYFCLGLDHVFFRRSVFHNCGEDNNVGWCNFDRSISVEELFETGFQEVEGR